MRGFTLAAALLASQWAGAAIVTEQIAYEHDGVALEGYLARDDARPGKLPVVLVVHEWWGLNDFARERARALAELGYIAFAVDMYGKGVVTSDPNEAGRLASQFRGKPELWRGRFKAALDAACAYPRADVARVAAIGFCFGGSTVLSAAAAGFELRAVVSFHGSLIPVTDAEAKNIRARILVLHGAADTLVPDAAVTAYQDSLRKSGADWEFVTYGGAKHGFMNPAADELKMPGVGYDRRAAERAWQHMRTCFAEALK